MGAAMRPVTVRTHISAPREQIFDLVADIGARPAWCGHYQKDFRVTRPATYGQGAAARWRSRKGWVETSIVEVDRPRRIVESLRTGRNNRVPGQAEYVFEPATQGVTRVELTIWTVPERRADALAEIGWHGWLKRNAARSLERLRRHFEEDPEQELPRATVAGWEQWRAPRFGGHLREPGAG